MVQPQWRCGRKEYFAIERSRNTRVQAGGPVVVSCQERCDVRRRASCERCSSRRLLLRTDVTLMLGVPSASSSRPRRRSSPLQLGSHLTMHE